VTGRCNTAAGRVNAIAVTMADFPEIRDQKATVYATVSVKALGGPDKSSAKFSAAAARARRLSETEIYSSRLWITRRSAIFCSMVCA
jgi:hypothetical protein